MIGFVQVFSRIAPDRDFLIWTLALQVVSQDGNAVREFVNKSAASAASLDYVKFQAVKKSAARAASPRGGRASGRLDHGFFGANVGRASSQNLGLCEVHGHPHNKLHSSLQQLAAAKS